MMPPLSPPPNEGTVQNSIYFPYVQCQGHIQAQFRQRKQWIIAQDKQFFLLKVIYMANSHR